MMVQMSEYQYLNNYSTEIVSDLHDLQRKILTLVIFWLSSSTTMRLTFFVSGKIFQQILDWCNYLTTDIQGPQLTFVPSPSSGQILIQWNILFGEILDDLFLILVKVVLLPRGWNAIIIPDLPFSTNIKLSQVNLSNIHIGLWNNPWKTNDIDISLICYLCLVPTDKCRHSNTN